MWSKYYFPAICFFAVVGIAGIFLSFVYSRETAANKPLPSGGLENSTVLSQEDEIPYSEQANAGTAFSVQTILVPGTEEDHDIILSSYLNPALRERVLAFFRDLTGSQEVAQAILSSAAVHNIPPALAFALCAEESGYKTRALNHNRNDTVDRGLFQLNSATFPQLQVVDFFNADVNARHGLAHLRWCLDTAGTEVAGLAMYNAGTNRVRSVGTPKDTLDYISRILNRQRKIEGLFWAEYARIIRAAQPEKEEKPPFRLSLLTPLGR